jgi:hypothetical protein
MCDTDHDRCAVVVVFPSNPAEHVLVLLLYVRFVESEFSTLECCFPLETHTELSMESHSDKPKGINIGATENQGILPT